MSLGVCGVAVAHHVWYGMTLVLTQGCVRMWLLPTSTWGRYIATISCKQLKMTTAKGHITIITAWFLDMISEFSL